MKHWYANATRQQKIFVWVIAGIIAFLVCVNAATMAALAVGLVPIGLLIYLQLGNGSTQPEKSSGPDGQH
jgi:hypothetical protein